jgi:hypothetical protein
MAYTPETAHEAGYGSQQSYNESMDSFRGATKHYRNYEDKMKRRVEARQAAQAAMQEREQKRRASVWSNLGLVGTILGAPFGGVGAAIGGALGSVAGMGIAAARGGNPFDMGAQFEYMDMGLLGGAASGVASSMAQTKAANDANRLARAENRTRLIEGGMDPAAFQPYSIRNAAPNVKLSDRLGEQLGDYYSANQGYG